MYKFGILLSITPVNHYNKDEKISGWYSHTCLFIWYFYLTT
jgi:hypothetical protein